MNILTNKEDALGFAMALSLIVGIAIVSYFVGSAMAASKHGNEYVAAVIINGSMTFLGLGMCCTLLFRLFDRSGREQAVENVATMGWGILSLLGVLLRWGLPALAIFGAAALVWKYVGQ